MSHVFGRGSSPAQQDRGSEHHSGEVIGDYKLIDLIGVGGMGVVWEAEQLSMRRRVALKMIQLPGGTSAKSLERFKREAAAGGRIAHPGIVQVYAVGEHDGLHYMVQELVEGGYSLSDWISDAREQREVDPSYYRLVAEIFLQIAEALEAAHSGGIVHRDIKPGNILMTADDHPKLADFGLAMIVDDPSLSRTGELFGTPFYMSPEQAMGRRIGIDKRTDMFSLGATLYHCLTLTRPFEGDTSQQVLERIVMVDPIAPKKLRSRVPWDLSVITMKALEKRREQRYQSMAEFAADLRRYLADEPIVARPPSMVTRAVKWTRRHPALAVSSIVVVLALAVTSNLLAVTSNLVVELNASVAREMLIAGEASHLMELAGEALKVSESKGYALALALAQSSISLGDFRSARSRIENSSRESPGWEWRHLQLRVAPNFESVDAHSNSRLDSFAVSPDGSRLLSYSMGEDKPHLLRTANLSTVRRLEGHDSRVVCASFDSESGLLATGGGGFSKLERSVRVWNAHTGKQVGSAFRVPKKNGDDKSVAALAFHPKDRSLAVTFKDGETFIWDLDTDERRALQDQVSAQLDRITCIDWGPSGTVLATGTDDGSVMLWDTTEGGSGSFRMSRRWTCKSGAKIQSVVFDSQGERVLAIDLYQTAYVIDTLDANNDVPGILHLDQIETLTPFCHTADLDRFAYGADDGSIWMYSGLRAAAIGSGEWPEKAEFNSRARHRDDVSCMAFNETGSLLASGAEDGTIRLWNGRTLEELTLFPGHAGKVTNVAFTPDGKTLLSSSLAGDIRAWDVAQRQSAVAAFGLRGEVGHINGLAANGSLVVSGSGDSEWSSGGSLDLWDARNGELLHQYESGEALFLSVALSPDGEQLVAATSDGEVQRWSTSGTRMSAKPVKHQGVLAVAFSPDGTVFVSGGEDRFLRFWMTETGEDAGSIDTGDQINALSFDRDGERVVTSSRGGSVTVWAIRSSKRLADLDHEDRRVFCVEFSPDGKLIATGTRSKRPGANSGPWAGEVWLWSAEDYVCQGTLEGHDGAVKDLAFNLAGDRLVTGSADRTVRIWQIPLGDELLVLSGHDDPVTSVAWSADEKMVLSGSRDGTLLAWLSDLEQARRHWAAALKR